jgi:hypothetical protein
MHGDAGDSAHVGIGVYAAGFQAVAAVNDGCGTHDRVHREGQHRGDSSGQNGQQHEPAVEVHGIEFSGFVVEGEPTRPDAVTPDRLGIAKERPEQNT